MQTNSVNDSKNGYARITLASPLTLFSTSDTLLYRYSEPESSKGHSSFMISNAFGKMFNSNKTVEDYYCQFKVIGGHVEEIDFTTKILNILGEEIPKKVNNRLDNGSCHKIRSSKFPQGLEVTVQIYTDYSSVPRVKFNYREFLKRTLNEIKAGLQKPRDQKDVGEPEEDDESTSEAVKFELKPKIKNKTWPAKRSEAKLKPQKERTETHDSKAYGIEKLKNIFRKKFS